MGVFCKERDDVEEFKRKVEELMSEYDKEEIDGPTYYQKMMELQLGAGKRNKK